MATRAEARDRRIALVGRLTEIYARAIRASGGSEYLLAHASPNSIRRQVEVFARYARFVPPGSRVLDWGCHHAPDSCMLREELGDAVTIHGCDFLPPGHFEPFHRFAGLEYRQLDDPIRLPYEAQTFDAVVSSGALEHAAMDLESLKELHRIIKEGGHLIITFLPNRLSYTEALARGWGLAAHLRLYGRSEAARMLLHHGFAPVHSGYHQFLPAHRARGLMKALWPLNGVLEGTWPLKLFCSNVFLVARRCSVI